MVTTYGTSSDISHFFRTQDNLFVPLLADLTVYSIFHKSRDYHVSEIAGAITGIAAYFVFAQRTSLSVNLLGAAVYLAYKVTHYFYVSFSSLTPEDLLAKQHSEFVKIVTSNEIFLDDEVFSLDEDMRILHEAEKIMSKASVLIRKKLREAEETVDLDIEEREKEIADQWDKDFHSLLLIFSATFSLVKQRALQVLSAGFSKANEQIEEELINSFCKTFGPCYRMNNLYICLYNDLSPLISHLPPEIQKLLPEIDKDNYVAASTAEEEEGEPPTEAAQASDDPVDLNEAPIPPEAD